MIVVSDTTPIITLLKIGHLDLLKKYFGNVQIPSAVYNELTEDMRFIHEAEQIDECPYIEVVDVENKKAVDMLRKLTSLDIGESEAIILSDDLNADLLLMDEAKGRDVAENMGIKIMGTIGSLLASYQNGMLSNNEIKECVEIIRNTGRHISEKYLQLLLSRIN